MAPAKKNENVIILGLVAVATGIYFVTKKSDEPSIDFEPEPTPVPQPQPQLPPLVLNRNLVLKNGSKGNEVKELQKLLKVSADGIFGSGTQNALQNLKGVSQITLNQFTTIVKPPITNAVSALKVGDYIMSNITSCQLYAAEQKADGIYFNTGRTHSTVGFGGKVGKIKALTIDNSYYSVYIEKMFGYDVVFVKTSAVKKM